MESRLLRDAVSILSIVLKLVVLVIVDLLVAITSVFAPWVTGNVHRGLAGSGLPRPTAAGSRK